MWKGAGASLRDIEITGAGLEEAFLELTGDPQVSIDTGPAPATFTAGRAESEDGRQ